MALSTPPQIAALYVQKDGVYFGLPGVDPWDESRDARRYFGPHPVVAHPPCQRWSVLAHVNEVRWGARVGEDGGCFEHALAAVLALGGVLEHPASSRAWPHFGLLKPASGRWSVGYLAGVRYWVTQVAQCAYGHRARKRTWLLYQGAAAPPALDWSEPSVQYKVGGRRNGGHGLPSLSKKEANATPIAFRDLLIYLARGSRVYPRARIAEAQP